MEAPFLWTSGGQFFLFYSANSYANGAHPFTVVMSPRPLALIGTQAAAYAHGVRSQR